MWIKTLKNISDDFEFLKPATEEALLKTEQNLGHPLPETLRELLLETNGVEQNSAYLLFILPIERIEKDNLDMRQNPVLNFYMPFDHLLFFADAGNGDKFAFPIAKDNTIGSDIFAWNHEDDSRMWCAPSLQLFIKWWMEGNITL